MKESRKLNLILNKDGHGTINYKIALPKKWIDELGFNENDKQATVEIDNKKIIIRKDEDKMERIDIRNFDFENRKGETLYCIEMVTNDKEEISKEIYACSCEKEAIEKTEEMNKHNQDNRYKFIQINYLVQEDYFEAV